VLLAAAIGQAPVLDVYDVGNMGKDDRKRESARQQAEAGQRVRGLARARRRIDPLYASSNDCQGAPLSRASWARLSGRAQLSQCLIVLRGASSTSLA
jgi:hypothetical protein